MLMNLCLIMNLNEINLQDILICVIGISVIYVLYLILKKVLK